jgi:hypothetical protein
LYKKVVRFLTTGVFSLLFLFGSFAPMPVYAESRDCDGNALIYCGTMSRTELKNKLNSGTGQAHQSSSELKALFTKYGLEMDDINNLHLGRVTKGNLVYVGDTVVARNVYTMGRHNISGSTSVPGFSYPLYKRHPSVSFLSDSLPAYVYTNYDGSMAYAIIRSCGNIVIGVGRRTRPVERVGITINKFQDSNGNGVRDTGEPALAGWQFRVTLGSTTRTGTTDSNGQIRFTNLEQGLYVVTEVLQPGWRTTTGLAQSRTVNTSTQTFNFGNVRVEETTEGGGDLVLPAVLPAAGLAENIAMVIAGIFALALLAYFGTKWYLRRTMRGHKAPTKPKDLIAELRRRTAARKKK